MKRLYKALLLTTIILTGCVNSNKEPIPINYDATMLTPTAYQSPFYPLGDNDAEMSNVDYDYQKIYFDDFYAPYYLEIVDNQLIIIFDNSKQAYIINDIEDPSVLGTRANCAGSIDSIILTKQGEVYVINNIIGKTTDEGQKLQSLDITKVETDKKIVKIGGFADFTPFTTCGDITYYAYTEDNELLSIVDNTLGKARNEIHPYASFIDFLPFNNVIYIFEDSEMYLGYANQQTGKEQWSQYPLVNEAEEPILLNNYAITFATNKFTFRKEPVELWILSEDQYLYNLKISKEPFDLNSSIKLKKFNSSKLKNYTIQKDEETNLTSITLNFENGTSHQLENELYIWK